MIFRQGDVLVVKTDKQIKNYEVIPPENDRIVLAHGEATGHTHSINSKNAIMVKMENKIFLMVLQETDLIHQEHSEIRLPIGNYEVIRQREYMPEGIKNVAD